MSIKNILEKAPENMDSEYANQLIDASEASKMLSEKKVPHILLIPKEEEGSMIISNLPDKDIDTALISIAAKIAMRNVDEIMKKIEDRKDD